LYLYPPPVTWLLVPWGKVSFTAASLVWFMLNAGLALGLAFGVPRLLDMQDQGAEAAGWLFLSSIPLWRTLFFGQNGLWLLGLMMGAYAFWNRKMDFRAGLLLSLGLAKPQFFFGFFLWAFLGGSWRMRGGLLLGSLLFLGLGCLPWGGEGWIAWGQTLEALRGGGENPLWLHSVWNVLEGKLGKGPIHLWEKGLVWGAIFFLFIVGICYGLRKLSREQQPVLLGFILLGSLLLSPRTYNYDLVLIYPLLLGAWQWSKPKNKGWKLTVMILAFYVNEWVMFWGLPLLTVLGLFGLIMITKKMSCLAES
jgi:hypothetical protein